MNNMISAFPMYLTTDSLFQKMVSLGAPWTLEIGKSMDMAYFTVYSGLKTPSSITTSIFNVDGVPSSQLISQVLWDMYGKNWSRLWDAYVIEYNPIENYNLQEKVARDQTSNRTIDKNGSLSSVVDGTVNSTETSSGTNDFEHGHIIDYTDTTTQIVEEQGTSTLEHGQSISTTGESHEFTYGFNSTTHIPTGDQLTSGTETHSGSDVTTTTGKTDTNSTDTSKQTNSGMDKTTTSLSVGTDTTTKDTRSDTTKESTTDDDTLNENITRTRSGNVGQHSYQDLLLQEFELWKWNFFEQVFADVDKFLCLSVYDQCSLVN